MQVLKKFGRGCSTAVEQRPHEQEIAVFQSLEVLDFFPSIVVSRRTTNTSWRFSKTLDKLEIKTIVVTAILVK